MEQARKYQLIEKQKHAREIEPSPRISSNIHQERSQPILEDLPTKPTLEPKVKEIHLEEFSSMEISFSSLVVVE